ncbi:SDR family oxidoreductase [Salirhabdus sp. Marseille-P4669]|uniref:SDR family oxidoreductase n=1 Tax=Salirhabdus sp. Marseille-P4669 TaxID=2042310 RepID=UPI000C7B616D|nr:SDR family oxidoreductase [Salirhabdus sp. Marseille-P4669]
MSKVAVITGASSGFGLLTTIKLAEEGYDVLATMRNLDKAKVFPSLVKDQNVLNRIEPFYVDVSDEESIQNLKVKLNAFPHVHLLVNNAGYALGGFSEEIKLEDYRKQFDTNVFGAINVTQAILPIMRRQQFGTIINVSSISGRVGFPGMSPYVSSKYALEGYSESLRLEVKLFGIQVALIEPGSYRTNIWSSSVEQSEAYMKEDSPYYEYTAALKSYINANEEAHGNPMEVAELISQIAAMKKIKKLRYPVGSGVKMTILFKSLLPWALWEKVVVKHVLKGKRDV